MNWLDRALFMEEETYIYFILLQQQNSIEVAKEITHKHLKEQLPELVIDQIYWYLNWNWMKKNTSNKLPRP